MTVVVTSNDGTKYEYKNVIALKHIEDYIHICKLPEDGCEDWPICEFAKMKVQE